MTSDVLTGSSSNQSWLMSRLQAVPRLPWARSIFHVIFSWRQVAKWVWKLLIVYGKSDQIHSRQNIHFLLTKMAKWRRMKPNCISSMANSIHKHVTVSANRSPWQRDWFARERVSILFQDTSWGIKTKQNSTTHGCVLQDMWNVKRESSLYDEATVWDHRKASSSASGPQKISHSRQRLRKKSNSTTWLTLKGISQIDDFFCVKAIWAALFGTNGKQKIASVESIFWHLQ